MVIFVSFNPELRIILGSLAAVLFEIGHKISAEKSRLAAFKTQDMTIRRLPELSINGAILKWAEEITYLGIRIRSDLSPMVSILDRIRAGEKKFYQFKKLIFGANNIFSKLKIEVYLLDY